MKDESVDIVSDHDEDGKIVPSDADFEQVEREHPNASLAEKYRLVQAAALIRAAAQRR